MSDAELSPLDQILGYLRPRAKHIVGDTGEVFAFVAGYSLGAHIQFGGWTEFVHYLWKKYNRRNDSAEQIIASNALRQESEVAEFFNEYEQYSGLCSTELREFKLTEEEYLALCNNWHDGTCPRSFSIRQHALWGCYIICLDGKHRISKEIHVAAPEIAVRRIRGWIEKH